MTNTKVKRGTDTRDIQASVSASLTDAQMSHIATRAGYLMGCAYPTGRPWAQADFDAFTAASDLWGKQTRGFVGIELLTGVSNG